MPATSSSDHPVLFTIGYQEATPAAVIGALRDAGVERLVDVRAVTSSRRPGFSKRQLAAGLGEAGIDYLHLRALGTPAEGRHAARTGRFDELRRIYEGQLATLEAQAELADLTRMIEDGRRVCLLCFERQPEHCHRSLIAERLRPGIEVRHLFPRPIDASSLPIAQPED
jgi:uncharacterized protein (DUF488 family)